MRRRDFGVIIPEGTATHPAFSVRWWEGGKWRRKRGFKTKTEAGAFLARIRSALSDGVLDAHRRADVTLVVVAEEWLTTHSAVLLRSHPANKIRWARMEAFFGRSTGLSAVSPSRIMELRQRLLREGKAPATVNRFLALLRGILNYAITAGYIDASPVRRFARGSYLLPEPDPADREPPFKDNQEALRVLLALLRLYPEQFALFAFLLLTGARRGEAAGLRWIDIDLARRVVNIRRSYDGPPKSGKSRTVPISAELAKILAQHRLRDRWQTALVFPHPELGTMMTPDVRLRPFLDAACAAAGVPRMKVHDLRHAHASLWLMAGGGLRDVQRNLGHSTPVLTDRTYGHLANDHRVHEADARLTLGLAEPPALAAVPGGEDDAAGGGDGD